MAFHQAAMCVAVRTPDLAVELDVPLERLGLRTSGHLAAVHPPELQPLGARVDVIEVKSFRPATESAVDAAGLGLEGVRPSEQICIASSCPFPFLQSALFSGGRHGSSRPPDGASGQVSPGWGSGGRVWTRRSARACCWVRHMWQRVQSPCPLLGWSVPPWAGRTMWSASVDGCRQGLPGWSLHPVHRQMGSRLRIRR